MNQKPQLPDGLDAEAEMRALRRARDAAREIAARTNTSLVTYRDGKIEHISVRAGPTPAGAGNESAAAPAT
jgi:hypothetical protein